MPHFSVYFADCKINFLHALDGGDKESMKAIKKVLNNIFIDGFKRISFGVVFYFDHRNYFETDW